MSLLHIVPPMALALTQYPGLASYDLSSVHTAMSAAAPMGRELQDHLMRALGIATVKQGHTAFRSLDSRARVEQVSGVA